MKDTFMMPKDFLWGAASSSFQIEGDGIDSGKGKSLIDCFPSKKGVADTVVASNHYHCFKEDIALMKELGLKSYHFSIAWSRVIPSGNGAVNQKGLDFYSQLIDELLKAGIEPIVSMYHFDLPVSLIEEYNGWHSRRILDDFTAYCKVLFEAFGDKVNYWIPLSGFNIETFYPKFNGGCDNPTNIEEWRFRMAHMRFLANAKVTKLGRELCPNAKIGAALDFNVSYPASSAPLDKLAVFNRNMHYGYFYYDVMFYGEYPKIIKTYLHNNKIMPTFEDGDEELLKDATPDFIGIYYYESTTVAYADLDIEKQEMEYNLTGKKGERTLASFPGLYKVSPNPHLETTTWDWPIDSIGFRLTLLELYDRYHLPIIIAENGLGSYETPDARGYVNDQDRIEYLRNHIYEMQKAMNEGVEIISYNIWSILDLVSTSNGFSKRYGLIRVNREEEDLLDLARIPKQSYYWYRKVIESNGNDLE